MTTLRGTRLRILIGLLAGPAYPGSAAASKPLRLPDVIASVERSHPTLEGQQRKAEAADGSALAARGGFDPKLAVKSKWIPVGYYEKTTIDASIQQATPAWGASVYAGYRFGWGDYEAYKGDLQTRSAGEVRAGLEIPVWRGGPIDPTRAKIAQTQAKQRGTRATVDSTRLVLYRDAARAYWKWVAAGQIVGVAEELLALARKRQVALDGQVAAGSVEAIKRVDNRRLVLSREAKVVAAEQKFTSAAIELSLFYRDDDQNPIQPHSDRVPAAFPAPSAAGAHRLQADVRDAVRLRPEMAAIAAEREAASVEVRLAKNERAPDAAVQTFVSKDFGDGGPEELALAEWGLGLVVSIPVPLRKARGELLRAKAELAGVDAKSRGLQDKIAAEVRKAYVALEAARKTWVLAEERVELVAALAEAERTKFREGASDLVVVNLRELAVADAQTEAIAAVAEYHRAEADYAAAIGRSPVDVGSS